MQQQILSVIFAAFGSLGFAVLFNIKGRKLIYITAGGALSYTFYICACVFLESQVIALLIATAATTLIAEVLARLLKAPTVILFVPILIPLVPGGDLYAAMNDLVRGGEEAFAVSSLLVLKEAAAIAFGIILVTSLTEILRKVQGYVLERRKTAKK